LSNPISPGGADLGVADRERIALLAYSFWERRGCQGGSPEEDWFRAEQEIRRLLTESQVEAKE
jgi:hypothetical protein